MVQNTLSSDSIKKGLKTRFVGQQVLYYSSLTSTMDVARREARQKATEGTVILAEEQTAGRGRLKRTWLSPSGNLALSVILYPSLACLPSLIMLASLAVVHSIGKVTGLKSQIKWPNDVLINGKKVCGILIENDVQGKTVNYAIIGVGINVNMRLAAFPEIQSIATSLADEAGRDISRLDMVRSLLVEMENLYLVLMGGGSIYEEWRDNLITLGKEVRVTAANNKYEGIAESVDKDGSLMLRSTDGKLTRVIAGDVTLRNRINGG